MSDNMDMGAQLFARGITGGGGEGGEGGGNTSGGAIFWWLPGVQINAFNIQSAALRMQNMIVAGVSFGKPGSWGDKVLKILGLAYEDFAKMAKEGHVMYGGELPSGGHVSSNAPSAHGGGMEIG